MISFMGVIDVIKSLETPTGVGGIIFKALRSSFYSINSLIYKFVAILYTMFRGLSNARLLNSEEFGVLATRVGLLLGVIMLFKVIIEFIQLLIDPDKINDSQKGAIAIVKRVIIVIVMLGVSSFAFESLYAVQSFVINNDLLYGFLLPRNDIEINKNKFGNVLAARVFGSFYTVDDSILNIGEDEAIQCDSYRNILLNNIALGEENAYDIGTFCLNAYGNYTVNNDSHDMFVMNYSFLLQFVVGIVLVYLLVSYVIMIGVRVIQLTVLQIISPMAIVGYLSTKQDNLFQRWTKLYISTYIDVFIRMAIIYFVVYLSSILLDTMVSGESVFWSSIEGIDTSLSLFARSMYSIAMILALLTFAKKAPDLIKQLIPNASGAFNPSWKNIVGLNRGVNTVAGAATGAAVGFIGGHGIGAIGGLFRGAKAGFGGKNLLNSAGSGWNSQKSHNQMVRDWRAAGGRGLGFGRWLSGVEQRFGVDPTAFDDRRLEKLKVEQEAYNEFSKNISTAEDLATKQIEQGFYTAGSAAGVSAAREALTAKNNAEIYRQQAGNLKRADYADDDAYNAAVQALNQNAIDADNVYHSQMKIARSSLLNDVSQNVDTGIGGGALAGINQAFDAARTIAVSNSSLEGFSGKQVDDFTHMDSVNSSVKGRSSSISNEMYGIQQSDSYKARQANKKFGSGGKK